MTRYPCSQIQQLYSEKDICRPATTSAERCVECALDDRQSSAREMSGGFDETHFWHVCIPHALKCELATFLPNLNKVILTLA